MKKNIFWLIIISLLLPGKLSPQSRAALPVEKESGIDTAIGKQYLVLIAINKYKYWNALRGAVTDAEEIGEILESRYVVDVIIKLYNEKATHENILKLFKKLQAGVKEKDSVFIFYAGHGHLDKASKTGYWIAVDGGRDDNKRHNWLNNTTTKGFIGNLKAKHILLVSDSCFAGDLLEIDRSAPPVIDNPYFKKAYSLRSRQVITSGYLEKVPDNSEFARQLKLALKESTLPIIDSLSLFDKIRPGLQDTFPVFGKLRGTDHQQGAAFLFFLKPGKEKSSQELKDPGSGKKPDIPPARVTGPDSNKIERVPGKGDPTRIKERQNWLDWMKNFQTAFDKTNEIDHDTAVVLNSKKKVWKQLLESYPKDNPYSKKDDELKVYAKKRIRYWGNFSKPEFTAISVEPSVKLRSQFKVVETKDLQEMVFVYNFFSADWVVNKSYCNPKGSFKNNFSPGDKVVVDLTTGLMWDRSGSAYPMKYDKAREWLNELNRNKYAGYNDWRIPTIEEAASLLKKEKNSASLHISDLFSAEQIIIWTGDTHPYRSLSANWVAHFRMGYVTFEYGKEPYVRPVRSIR